MTTFGIRSGARVETIIDGVHLYNVARNLLFDIDFRKLRTLIQDEYDSRKFTYAMRVLYDDHGEIVHAAIAKLLDYVRFNGYKTLLGESQEWTDSTGRRGVSKLMDVPITLAMFQAARHVDEILVFAGSDELIPVFEECSNLGVRVTLVSAKHMVSPELRAAADWFVDIADIKDKIVREPRGGGSETNTAPVSPNRSPALESAVVVEDRRDSPSSFQNRMRIHPRSTHIAT